MYLPHFHIVTIDLPSLLFMVHVLCNRIMGEYNVTKRSVTISIYLLVYYLGSSVLGPGTGLIPDLWEWPCFLGGLIIIFLFNYWIIWQGVKAMKEKTTAII